MPGFYPVPSTRSTHLMAQTRLVQQINIDQAELLKLQTAISTGRRFARPGEDPAAAQRGQTLQRLLELKAQAQTNAQTAQSYLDASDTALSNVASILTEIRGLAVAAANDTSGEAERAAVAAEVDQAIKQLLNTANQQFRGRYLFAGSRSTAVPFSEASGGVIYTGNEGSLNSFVDLALPFATNGSGTEVFGTFSAEVQGTVDLNPALTASTPISALFGGEGITLGSIEVSDGSTASVIDLSSAATVDDIARLIEANPPAGRTITATVTATGLTIAIDVPGGGSLTIRDLPGGTTADDLGILTSIAGVGTTPVVGDDLNPTMRLTTLLADLQTIAPLDLTSGLQIVNAGATYTIDTSAAQTVEDLLNLINYSGAGALAEIAPTGDRLVVRSRLSGADFSIGENGGTTATQLGIRSLTTSTALADLNSGLGVTGITGADFTIHRKDGTDLPIDISSAVTVGDVLNLINNDPANLNPATRVVARLAAFGNGIELFDGNTAGTDTLSINAPATSDAAINLGLIPSGQLSATANTSGTGDTLAGADVNPLEVSGLFNSLLRLHDALTNFSHERLSRAVALLDEDFDRVVFARSELGARNQTIDTVKTQLEDEVIELQSNLSDNIDTDLTEAISTFTARQAAMQATLQFSATLLRMTLLDFI